MNTLMEKTQCPYCENNTTIKLPINYAPVYMWCEICGKKFIIERMSTGFQAIQVESAPCCSDPDCRELEMGSSDEQ